MNIKNNSDLNLEAILGLIKSKKFVEANSQINKFFSKISFLI